MMVGPLDVTAPALALTGLYGVLVLLLLSLHLRSAWRWPVKSAAIGLAIPATIGAFLTIQAQLGWPSRASMPASFQLHAALVSEPAVGVSDEGAIFLWLTPWDDVLPVDETGLDAAMLPSRPRAFDLPYSRDLHQQVQDMQERLARGEVVVGRHERNDGWQRRFGRQDGMIDLEAPPPPPLPAKDP